MGAKVKTGNSLRGSRSLRVGLCFEVEGLGLLTSKLPGLQAVRSAQ